MKSVKLKNRFLFFCLLLFCHPAPVRSQPSIPAFRVLVMAEAGGIHLPFVQAASTWLGQLASDSGFAVDYIDNTRLVNEKFLSAYQLIIQLNYPPYGWGADAVRAFEQYIEQGRGGWIGFHHATLLGEFDGYPIWPWFSDFMGGIRFQNYIAGFARARVEVEDSTHPIMRGVARFFFVDRDEWYTYNRSPRLNKDIHVIARVDESSYSPDSEIKMGDHPVIWTNGRFPARNVYIFMGHSADLFQNDQYKIIFRNAVFWAARKQQPGNP
jgi:uncharacterized protein